MSNKRILKIGFLTEFYVLSVSRVLLMTQMIWNVRQVQLISSRIMFYSRWNSFLWGVITRNVWFYHSLRPLDDCFLKPLMRLLETFKKVVTKIKANPFERFCRSLDFFAYSFKPLANPLKALEKPLTSRSLAISFYPWNGKLLVYIFLETVTYSCWCTAGRPKGDERPSPKGRPKRKVASKEKDKGGYLYHVT